MAKEIKQKIVLDGEKEYSAALKEANRNLKTLKSELKAETAEMGRNASEAEKSRIKRQNLRKQIAEQEKVVKTYRQALQEVREKYADNEDAIASWEQKLNSARATLGNMKKDLEGVGDSFKSVEQGSAAAVTATKSIADAIGRVSQVGDTVSDTIEGIFMGMVGTVERAFQELWGLMSDTAAKANNWTDVAGYWNTDPQKIQQWARAVAASQNEFTDLNNAVSKLAYGDHDKIRKLTGVSWAGDIDQWQYAMDVLSSIASMDYAHKTNALEEVFGEKRASKIMDILNDWKTIQEMLPQFNGNETGFGMSDEGLKVMDNLYVEMGKLDAKWDAIKDKVASGLGVAALNLSISVEGMLDGVADFLNAKDEGEREAALGKIRSNLEGFFRKLGEVVQECIGILREVGSELQNSDDPVTKAIGDILKTTADTLQWMIDNQQAVKGAFEAIFGVWLLAKLAAVAGKLLEIVKNIETIKAFKDWKTPTVDADGSGTPASPGTGGSGTPTGGNGTPAGGNGGAGSENVATQNVTTQNTTTENTATENVTTQNVAHEKTTLGKTDTEHVQNMYVQNMVGGSKGNGGGQPGDGGNNTINLPGNNTINLPGNNTMNLPGGNALNLPGENALNMPGENTMNLPGGNNVINLPGSNTLNLPGENALNLPNGGSAASPAEGAAPTTLPTGSGGVPLILPPTGGGGPSLPTGDNTINLGGDNTINLGGDNSIELGPNDYTISEPGKGPAQEPAAKQPESSGARFQFDPYTLAPMIVAAAALIPPYVAQKGNEEAWKEEQDLAGEIADAVESAFGDSEIADLIRATAAAVGPKKNADGSYQKDFTGLFLNMNPTDQMDYILQGLGDVKKRGQLYADILRYGDPNNDNVAGWKPWSALLRYWGEYTDERGNRQDLPLDPFEVDELVRYIRDLYEKKAQAQLEKEKEEKQKRLEDAMRNGDFGLDAQRRIEEDDFNKALDEALGGSGKNSPSGGFAAGLLRFLNADQWLGGGGNSGGSSQQEGITSSDIDTFRRMPAQIELAAQRGTAKGVSGIKVTLDGVAVGRLMAPIVSQMIARDIG